MLNSIRAVIACSLVVVAFAVRTSHAADDAGTSQALSLHPNYLAAAATTAEANDDYGPAPVTSRASVARDTTWRFRAFGIYSNASGSLEVEDDFPNIPGDLDFEDTLGMDMDQFSGGGVISYNFGSRHRWHLDAGVSGYFDYDGSKNVGSIEFNGNVFTGDVKSRLKIIEGFGALNYDLWLSDAENLTLTVGLDLHLFYVDAKLIQILGDLRESHTIWVPAPVPSIALRWDITPNFYTRGKAAGLWLGDLGDFYDVSAEIGYDFNRNVGLFVGYQFWGLRFDYSDDEVDFDTNRIYAGIELRI